MLVVLILSLIKHMPMQSFKRYDLIGSSCCTVSMLFWKIMLSGLDPPVLRLRRRTSFNVMYFFDIGCSPGLAERSVVIWFS